MSKRMVDPIVQMEMSKSVSDNKEYFDSLDKAVFNEHWKQYPRQRSLPQYKDKDFYYFVQSKEDKKASTVVSNADLKKEYEAKLAEKDEEADRVCKQLAAVIDEQKLKIAQLEAQVKKLLKLKPMCEKLDAIYELLNK